MSRFLITGAAGFIGSSLARALVADGHHVRCIDNLSSGSLNNLSDISDDIEFRCVDVRDLDKVRSACKGVEFVLHHAAVASVPQSVEDPVETHNINVTGTLNVLVAARDAGVRRLVFAASSSAYGSEGATPKLEWMASAPLSPYAVQKLAGEYYVKNFSLLYGLEGVCLRYFNIFGPRQSADSPYSGVIACFVRKMLSRQRPCIFGNGHQSRDFTFIDNVVAANRLACSAPSSDVSGQVFNIGTGRSHSLNQLYVTLADLLGFEEAPKYKAPRLGDVLHSEADITLARSYLHYEPSVTFETGLQRTTAWYTGAELSLTKGQAIPKRLAQCLAMN